MPSLQLSTIINFHYLTISVMYYIAYMLSPVTRIKCCHGFSLSFPQGYLDYELMEINEAALYVSDCTIVPCAHFMLSTVEGAAAFIGLIPVSTLPDFEACSWLVCEGLSLSHCQTIKRAFSKPF